MLTGDFSNACHEFYRGAKLVQKEKADKAAREAAGEGEDKDKNK